MPCQEKCELGHGSVAPVELAMTCLILRETVSRTERVHESARGAKAERDSLARDRVQIAGRIAHERDATAPAPTKSLAGTRRPLAQTS